MIVCAGGSRKSNKPNSNLCDSFKTERKFMKGEFLFFPSSRRSVVRRLGRLPNTHSHVFLSTWLATPALRVRAPKYYYLVVVVIIFPRLETIEQGSGVTRGKGVGASYRDSGWGAKGKKHAHQHAGSKLERFRRRQNLRDRSGEKKSCQLKAVLVGLAAAAPPAEPAQAGDAGADTVVDGAF